MRKVSIKLMALLTALAMMTAMAGCGERVEEESVWIDGEGTTQTITHSSGSSSTDSTSSTSSKSGTSSKAGTSSAAVNEEDRTTDVDGVQNTKSDYNLKGATVTIAGYGEYGAEVQPSSPYYSDWKTMVSTVEKKYNCKIEFKVVEDSMSYLSKWVTAAQSGVKFADIVTLATSWPYPTHMKQGYLYALDDYLDLSEKIYNQNAIEAVKYKGKHYLTVMINRVYVGQGLVFNPNIFEQYGVTTPHEYIAKNNWNYDTFLEVCQQITTKSSGKVYGIDDVNVNTFAINNGGKLVSYKNGKYTFTGNTDKKYLKGAQFAHDLLNTYKVVGGDFDKSTSAMGFCASYNTSDLDSALGSGNWGWAYIPHGWDVNDYQIEVTETTSYGIPKTVKNPEAIAQIMYDFTYPYKWKTTFEEESESKFGDETSYNIYLDFGYRGLENQNLTPLYTYITRSITWGGDGKNMGLSTDASKVKSPQVYFSEVAATAQAELDSVWDQ